MLKLINAFALPSPLTFLKTENYVAPFCNYDIEVTLKDDVSAANKQ